MMSENTLIESTITTTNDVLSLTEIVNGLKAIVTSDEDIKSLTELSDSMTFELLIERLNHYNYNYTWTDNFNKKLSEKKERHENFPSSCSENIAKFAICKYHGIMPSWHTKKGDLEIHYPESMEQIEVKGFMSDGPLSFGPGEGWDRIYFVDAINTLKKEFKVYEINLSNTSDRWRQIKLSGCVMEPENIMELPENLEDLEKMKSNDLKSLCKGRGLKMTGKKDELISRLKTQTPGSGLRVPQTFGDIVTKDQRGKLRGSFYKIFKPQLGDHCKLIFDGNIEELDNSM